MVSSIYFIHFLLLFPTLLVLGTDFDTWLHYNNRLPRHTVQELPHSSVKSGKIIGGSNARIDEFPYQLSLRRNNVHACGASIITLRWALSAAHCAYPLPDLNMLTLRAGSDNRLFGGTIYNVLQVVIHPQYSDYTMEFDVCLLYAGADFVGQFTSPVLLPPATSGYAAGTLANATGWGLQSVPNSLPVQLQWVSMPLISNADCRTSWPYDWITEDMLCTSQSGRDTCNGDSGGPLVVNGYQMGISSWGTSDCSGNYPAIYASTAHPRIRNFILEYSGV